MIWLLFAHFIGDINLQAGWFQGKDKNIQKLIIHSYIWACCIAIALCYIDKFTVTKFMFLFVGHAGMDHFNCKYKLGAWDRVFHFFQIGVVYAMR